MGKITGGPMFGECSHRTLLRGRRSVEKKESRTSHCNEYKPAMSESHLQRDLKLILFPFVAEQNEKIEFLYV
jgi:hypothetical protein